MALQGLIAFKGISPRSITGGKFTRTIGISPDTSTITCTPLIAGSLEPNDLVVTFGGVTYTSKKSIVKTPTLTVGESGFRWQVPILDRRWKWEFGEISGRYNVRETGDVIKAGTEKKPRELARLLLKAMGEKNFTVKDLPNDARPSVSWDAANPAQELAALCESLGCVVVLQMDDRVFLRVKGKGKKLPAGGTAINRGYGITTKAKPDKIKILCGPTLYQLRLKLEAVGIEKDGTIKKINDLSYKPGFWGDEYPLAFLGVEDKDARQLALKTVYRWYRVIPDGVLATTLAEILPVSDTLIETRHVTSKDTKPLPAEVWGEWWDQSDDTSSAGHAANCKRFDGKKFSIDRDKGIVQFEEPVYSVDSIAGNIPATLYLETCFAVTDKTGQKNRYEKEKKTPGKQYDTGPLVLKHPEIVYHEITSYLGCKRVGTTNNKKKIDAELDDLLDAEISKYATSDTAEIEYAGAVKLELDGAINQISVEVGEQGCRTRASRNTSHDLANLGFLQRRKAERNEKARQELLNNEAVKGAIKAGRTIWGLVTGQAQ